MMIEQQHRSDLDAIADVDVVITGGTSGLGAAFARQYARLGYSVLITGRRQQALIDTAQSIEAQFSVRCLALQNDLGEPADLDQLTAYISNNKQLKALVNNAGFNTDGDFHRLTREQHQAMLATHVTATTLLSHAAMPNLIANQGQLILVASLAAEVPTPQSPLYGPTKAYIKQLAATLHAGYRPQGVGIIAVCPGFFRSDFHAKLGLKPEQFYRNKGLLKALSADTVAHDALDDWKRGRLISVSGWNYRLLHRLIRLIPDRLLVALIATRKKARL